MDITYIGHSGFLMEWETCYLLFDYYIGTIPEFDINKNIYVFASHKHEDHFNPEIFKLSEKYPDTRYILSSDIKLTPRKIEMLGITDDIVEHIVFVKPYHEYRMSDKNKIPTQEIIMDISENNQKVEMPNSDTTQEIKMPNSDTTQEIKMPISETSQEFEIAISEPNKPASFVVENNKIIFRTLKSTDCGVAFLLHYQGKTIYHAGDLNLWIWKEETKQYNNNMNARFCKEMDALKDVSIDIAFVPLDPRLEENYYMGMQSLINTAKIKYVFPMHFQGNASIIEKFKRERATDIKNTKIMDINLSGQRWNIDI